MPIFKLKDWGTGRCINFFQSHTVSKNGALPQLKPKQGCVTLGLNPHWLHRFPRLTMISWHRLLSSLSSSVLCSCTAFIFIHGRLCHVLLHFLISVGPISVQWRIVINDVSHLNAWHVINSRYSEMDLLWTKLSLVLRDLARFQYLSRLIEGLRNVPTSSRKRCFMIFSVL